MPGFHAHRSAGELAGRGVLTLGGLAFRPSGEGHDQGGMTRALGGHGSRLTRLAGQDVSRFVPPGVPTELAPSVPDLWRPLSERGRPLRSGSNSAARSSLSGCRIRAATRCWRQCAWPPPDACWRTTELARATLAGAHRPGDRPGGRIAGRCPPASAGGRSRTHLIADPAPQRLTA